MGKNVYITNLSSFLPNEPVENDAMEDVLGYIGGHSSRIKRIILSQNQIKQRYYAIILQKEYTYLKSKELEELPLFRVMSWQPS